MNRYTLSAVIIVVLLGAGVGVYAWRQESQQRQAAAQARQEADRAAQERNGYQALAQALAQALEGVQASARTQAQEIARLKARHPQILQPPPGVPDPCPELRELAVRQDGLIQIQDQELGLHRQREIALEGQAAASEREARALRVEIAQIALDRPWSVGPLLGANFRGELRLGAIASGSFGRVQSHALVLGDQVAVGLTFRFGGGR